MYKYLNILLALMLSVTLLCSTGAAALADDGGKDNSPQSSMWGKLADLLNTTVDNVKSMFGADKGGRPASDNNDRPPRQDQGGNSEQQTRIIARAAEILGISTDNLTSAYETARKSIKPRRGPSDNRTGDRPDDAPPPPPRSDNGTDRQCNNPPPPGGQGGPDRKEDKQAIYTRVAELLGLPADKVIAAFEQAEKELKPDNNQQQKGNGGKKGNNGGNPSNNNSGNSGAASSGYSLEQAMSDKAQLSTIAFSGLAFMTGSAGADSFFPPGKVADFFGFQYMRDVDTAGYGHNTTFLSKAANNVLKILSDEQKARLVALAKEQEAVYVNFAYNRFPLMAAFRNNMEGKLPSGASGISLDAIKTYTGNLYSLDAQLSYRRAEVVGGIIASFSADQKAYLAKMEFNNSATWPEVSEDTSLKKNLTNTQFVAVMTYASELFSWYKGNINADIYFCPERHGTYFGGFYMKDYPAMNNPDYFISTSITGDSGEGFLKVLTDTQRQRITGIIEEQRGWLKEIGEIRTSVATELRKSMAGQSMDKEKAYSLIKRYGQLDGQMSGLYAVRFAEVNKTLTSDQRAALVKLRNLTVVPKGAYMFSTPINYPSLPSIDYLFGIGQAPSDSGQATAPAGFSTGTDTRPGSPANK